MLELFNQTPLDTPRLEQLASMPEPRSRYIIAITPRSGSSYLSNMLAKTGRFGSPPEPLGEKAVARLIRQIPARTPDEYVKNIIQIKKSKNGVSGLKASWFQFRNFMDAMTDASYFDNFKFIYLTRQNLDEQAVSLYKATASSVFHTDKSHSEDALNKLANLDYDFAEIDYWQRHIVAQEQGWQQYFAEKNINALAITYEEIEQDILQVMRRIAVHVHVNPDAVMLPETASAFRKISDNRNSEWAARFALEKSYEASLSICDSNITS